MAARCADFRPPPQDRLCRPALISSHRVRAAAFVALWAEHAAERMPTWVPAILKAPAEGAKDSRLDEIFCYGLFALGFFFQLSHGFAVPFPLNVVLLPVSLLETFLRYQVTWH